jgi:hypothetical protein
LDPLASNGGGAYLQEDQTFQRIQHMYLPAEESVNLMITRNVATGLATGPALHYPSPLRDPRGKSTKKRPREARPVGAVIAGAVCSRVSSAGSQRTSCSTSGARSLATRSNCYSSSATSSQTVWFSGLLDRSGAGQTYPRFLRAVASLSVSHFTAALRGAPLPAVLPARQALYRHRAGAAIKMEL